MLVITVPVDKPLKLAVLKAARSKRLSMSAYVRLTLADAVLRRDFSKEDAHELPKRR